MKKIAIIGGGELGIQIANLIVENTDFQIAGFIDDFQEIGHLVDGNNWIIGKTSNTIGLFAEGIFDALVLAIGYKHMNVRKHIFELFSELIPFETIIHKSCIISPSAKIGDGSVLYAGCIIDKNVVIEKDVLLNLKSVVSHDTKIGSHCFIAPSVTISGFVDLGECNFVGSGALIKDNTKICAGNIIGIGSVVIGNINKKGVYFGNPSKFKYELQN